INLHEAAFKALRLKIEDPDSFRPARDFLIAPFDTFKAISRVLKKNHWIRRRKPSKQRLEIHAGDWHKFLSQNPSDDMFDQSAAVVDAMLETEKRKDEIRRNREGN